MSVNPPQAVIFDFGGVLYRMPDPKRMLRMLRFFGVRDAGPFNMLMASPVESPLVMDLMTGRLVEKDLWDRMARELRIRPALLRLFRQHGLAQRHFDQMLAHFLAGLRPRFHTAILTNAGSDFRETFGRVYGLEKLVDHLIISAEEGLAKPDPRFYHLAAERLGVPPEEAIFVDDIPENVDSALQVGLIAFLHKESALTIARIQELLRLK